MACTICVQVRGLRWLPADAHLPAMNTGVRLQLAQSACRSEGSAGCQLTRTCLQHVAVSQAGVSHHGLHNLRAGLRALLAASSRALACHTWKCLRQVCQVMACTSCVQVRGLCWLPADAHLPAMHAGVSVYGGRSLRARLCVSIWRMQSACNDGGGLCWLPADTTCLQCMLVSQAMACTIFVQAYAVCVQ